tara:strand:- start:2606 stop:3769 length:1164 start_codon:yes stop_codon:yes gene_type:complete
MKISIIVGGRFHAFDLAQYLNENKFLEKLITSYPKFYIKKNYQNIDIKKVDTIILKELLNRLLGKVNFFKKDFDVNDLSSKYFRKQASKLIDYNKNDIILGWSGFSLDTFKKAQNYNCFKILERGSTHILFQNEILKEEYDLLGLKPNLPSSHIIEVEQEEYKIADHIMVPSEFAKNTFIKKGFDGSKISKVPYGVNLGLFKSKKKTKDSKFRIIYTGMLSVRKGVIYLLKAFSELNLKNAELVLIGAIENSLKKKIIKYFDNNNIIYNPAINQSELPTYYSNSDLFVTCSIEEGLAMVQMQAMASGLAIICTENSGGRELVDENYNGFIIDIRNVDVLKQKILYLYNNRDQLFEMGLNSENKAKNLFSWDKYGFEVIKKYKEILYK